MENEAEHVILWCFKGMLREDLAPLCTIRTCIDIYPILGNTVFWGPKWYKISSTHGRALGLLFNAVLNLTPENPKDAFPWQGLVNLASGVSRVVPFMKC